MTEDMSNAAMLLGEVAEKGAPDLGGLAEVDRCGKNATFKSRCADLQPLLDYFNETFGYYANILVPLTFACVLLVSACDSSPQDRGAQTPVAARSMSSVHHYRCESGETIATTYSSTNSATVQYKGRIYDMQIAVSGSGSRYVGGELEWWTKGSGPQSEGTLFRHMADGTSGESIERCTESQVRPPAASAGKGIRPSVD